MNQDEKRILAQTLNQEAAQLAKQASDKSQEAADVLGSIGPINNSSDDAVDLVLKDIENEHPEFTEIQLTNNADGIIRQHGYSTRQAFNADESLIHLPAGEFKIVNLLGNVVMDAPVSSEYNWHPSDPDVMFGVRDRQHFCRVNLSSGKAELIFSGDDLRMGSGHGNIDNAATFAPIDTQNKVGVLDLQSGSYRSIDKPFDYDWHGVSHFGNYCVMATEHTTHVYDIDMNHLYDIEGSEHSDFGHYSGKEYLVTVGRIPYRLNLGTGEKEFLASDTAWTWGHLSGRGPENRIYYSVHEGKHEGWNDYSIGYFTLSLGLSSNIEIAKVDHSRQTDYMRQMKLTVSPSGNHVIYTSDKANGVINDFLVTMK